MASPEDIKYILIFGLLRVVGDLNTFSVVPHPGITIHCLDENRSGILIVRGAFCGSPSVAHSGEYDTWKTTKGHLSIPESSHAWERDKSIEMWYTLLMWNIDVPNTAVSWTPSGVSMFRDRTPSSGISFCPCATRLRMFILLNLLNTIFGLCLSLHPVVVRLQSKD